MDYLDCDDERDDRRVTRPETDLGEGNASRHATEDFRRTTAAQQDTMWIDPVTGEPTILP
jgi:hypothetical protein